MLYPKARPRGCPRGIVSCRTMQDVSTGQRPGWGGGCGQQAVPVLSGMVAWSVFRSCFRTTLPNWRTAETIRSMAEGKGGKVRGHCIGWGQALKHSKLSHHVRHQHPTLYLKKYNLGRS